MKDDSRAETASPRQRCQGDNNGRRDADEGAAEETEQDVDGHEAAEGVGGDEAEDHHGGGGDGGDEDADGSDPVGGPC